MADLDELFMGIGRAIDIAAGSLPDGWNIRIDVERGAAVVLLSDPEGNEEAMDVDADNRIAAEIVDAVRLARKRETQQRATAGAEKESDRGQV